MSVLLESTHIESFDPEPVIQLSLNECTEVELKGTEFVRVVILLNTGYIDNEFRFSC